MSNILNLVCKDFKLNASWPLSLLLIISGCQKQSEVLTFNMNFENIFLLKILLLPLLPREKWSGQLKFTFVWKTEEVQELAPQEYSNNYNIVIQQLQSFKFCVDKGKV